MKCFVCPPTHESDDGNRRFRAEDIEAALRRAALKARELAERTKTPFYVLRDGKVVDLLAKSEKPS